MENLELWLIIGAGALIGLAALLWRVWRLRGTRFRPTLINDYADAYGGKLEQMASGRTAALFTRDYGRLLVGCWLEADDANGRPAPHVQVRVQWSMRLLVPDVIIERRLPVERARVGYRAFVADDPALDGPLAFVCAESDDPAAAQALVAALRDWLLERAASGDSFSLRISAALLLYRCRTTPRHADELHARVTIAEAAALRAAQRSASAKQ